ncbi:uncharacterized protein LOC120112561 [Phoenix dactylifera]|uniref:Uncharacterized protein LOC120112561 n=1 Tax=Phoenix dactylifera TaxID=42345 RepID=A0A8B9AW75_PHODC|nr:uncharacterized protein LOC120112561 [Phoenix dactylifera]
MERAPLDIFSDAEVSFSCMASGQLQNSPTEPRLSTDPNFEFRSSGPSSPSPADVLFSDGHLMPHSYPMNKPTKTSRSSPTSNATSRSSSASSSSGSSGGSARRCLRKSGERVPAAEPKRVSFQLSSGVDGGWQLPGASLGTTSSIRSGSGRYRAVGGRGEARNRKEAGKQQRGLFGCIVSACRECHALEPSKVVDTNNNKIIPT